MSTKESKTNNTILRAVLVAAVVLLFCGAAVGAVGAQTIPDAGGNISGEYILEENVTLSSNLTVIGDCTIDLNGYVLEGNGNGSVITVNSGKKLTVTDSDTSEKMHYFSRNENGLYTYVDDETSTGNIEITGGCITGGVAKTGAGVHISPGGTFTLSGGNIVGNSATGTVTNDQGGGVYVGGYDEGAVATKFSMTGGTIIGNCADSGAGVYVSKHGTFEMSNGSIESNTATNGGGVDVRLGTFTMSGGSITKNTATERGGGVYVAEPLRDEYGTFTMSAGTIEQNKATENGGGVYVGANGVFNVSGMPVITNNKKSDSKNNVYLCGPADGVSQMYVKVTGNLTDGAYIGIASPAYGQFGIATNDTIAEASASSFHLDSDDTKQAKASGAKLKWPHVAKIESTEYESVSDAVTDASSGATIILMGDTEEETITVSKTITLNLNGHVLSNPNEDSVIKITENGDLTLNDSSGMTGKITGGKATNGGGVNVEGTFTMNGGNITGNTAAGDEESGDYGYGGGVYVWGVFEMNGGSITNNTAFHPNVDTFGRGGGVFVNDGATFKVSGSPVIKDNMDSKDATNNVVLEEVNDDEDEMEGLYLSGDFNGEIRITAAGYDDEKQDFIPPKAGEPFGRVSGSNFSGAENFKADGTNLFGSIETDDGHKILVWKAPSTPSSKSQGTSVWLTEQLYTVTFYLDGQSKDVYQIQTVSAGQTASVPSPAPVAEGRIFDGWYTDRYCTMLYEFSAGVYSDLSLYAGWNETPSVQPVAEQPTAKSPVPFLGVLAGLGAAGVVLAMRMRR